MVRLFRANWRKRLSLTVLSIVIVAAALAFNAYWLGESSGRNEAQAHGYSAQYPSDTAKQVGDCWLGIEPSAARKCAEDAIAASRESQRSEGDLQAQREMSDWAFWLLVVSVAQLPITIIGLWALVETISQGRDANEIARESGVAQDRAWIKLSVAATQISVTRDSIVSRAKVKTENVGNSVALDVTCWASLHIGHTGDFMDKGFFDSLPPQFYGSQQSYVIWPDDSLSHDRNANGLGVSTHEIIGNNYRVFLLATAEYRTIFDKPTDLKRRTELIVELKRSDASFVIAEDLQLTSEVHRLVNVRHSNIGSGEVT